MNSLKIVVLLFVLYLSFSGISQHTQLHWYTLKSVVNLTAAEGKEALGIIRNNTTDYISSFTDKSNMFKLATTTAVEMNVLMHMLNTEGFYIANVTTIEIHTVYERSSEAFQLALLFCRNKIKFDTENIGFVKLKRSELELLKEDEKQTIMASNVFNIEK